MPCRFVAVFVLALAFLSTTFASNCDRHCMLVVLDAYLNALINDEPATAPLADDFRSTENQHEIAMGGGLWASMSGLGALLRRFVDTVGGQAAFYGIINEGQEQALASIRVRIEEGKITESEAVVARDFEPLFNIQAAIDEQPAAGTMAGPQVATSREQLLDVANTYFQALADSDGSPVPKVEGCIRVENGTRVTQRRMPAAPWSGQSF